MNILQAKVDVDGGELVHILFEKGHLNTVHYTVESEHEDDRHTHVYKVDPQIFTVNAASRGSFILDISEDASDTFLLLRIRTENRASATFNLEGYQGFRIGPAQEQILAYSKAGDADCYRKV